MKVFISWSGETSRRVAGVIREWLPSVIQAVTPYVSSEDIDKGARWSSDISGELELSNYGILCVTKGNIQAPWLNFEAGALSKSFDSSRVSPFLFGVERPEVTGPLLQFQSTINEREDVLKLVRSINKSCKQPLEEPRLDQIFSVWWPTLQTMLAEIEDCDKPTEEESEEPQGRSTNEILDEVLELVRAQQKILSRPDELIPPSYLATILDETGRRSSLRVYRDLEVTVHRLRSTISGLRLEDGLTEEKLELLEQISVRLTRMVDYLVDEPTLRRGGKGGRPIQPK